MPENNTYPGQMVFGLDIGTRSIVGTVGYKENEQFNIVAQCVKTHDTRAMLDGQIHDIQKVGETVSYVKKQLEEKIGRPLKNVCIAAAGRVLNTAIGFGELEFEEETTITTEHIYSLDLAGTEKAQDKILQQESGKEKYVCVGYSVVKYFLNDYVITNLEGHKATKIGAEVLATFLPEDVIDGLYKAVEIAGLEVETLTLEPIAAINVAIPQQYRLLNIALVDVGAGTSDICVTKDGSIIGYGMIPYAGDKLTEKIVQNFLVDFQTAETIKQMGVRKKTVTYKDIMGISQKATKQQMLQVVEGSIDEMTTAIAEKIKELNGGNSVNAVFVVGGGGKIETFTDKLAKALDLPKERVALRGEEVLGSVNMLQEGIKKDPILVTPIGICLNFYDQKNNFIFVHVNEERVKLYDNDKLTVVDAALQIGLPYERLFPRRGSDIVFEINGKQRIIRGKQGEAAVITLNGTVVGLTAKIKQGDRIVIQDSTVGEAAEYTVGSLPEYSSTIEFIVNDKKVVCPKFAMVNKKLESEFYQIQNKDKVDILSYYTVEQLFQFMDMELPNEVYINHEIAGLDDKIYENFKVEFTVPEMKPETTEEQEATKEQEDKKEKSKEKLNAIKVQVNDKFFVLTGKDSYVLVDAMDISGFQVTDLKGEKLITKINNQLADFATPIQDGDEIAIYWEN